MKQNPEVVTQSYDLKVIAEQIRLLTAAVQKQNELLEACILKPDGRQARIMVGTTGAIEVIEI